MQAEHEEPIFLSGTIYRPFDRSANALAAWLEWIFERPLVAKQDLRCRLMHAVVGVPEPQISLRQRLMQRLRGRDRYQPLLVRASEEDGSPRHLRSCSLRWSKTRWRMDPDSCVSNCGFRVRAKARPETIMLEFRYA